MVKFQISNNKSQINFKPQAPTAKISKFNIPISNKFQISNKDINR